jgi:hypothetical protein
MPEPIRSEEAAAAECAALAAAIAESDADPRVIQHEDMRVWLLEIARGNFDARPPSPR